ncbi:hypothetical protein D3C72_1849980 [compost metagenome]
MRAASACAASSASPHGAGCSLWNGGNSVVTAWMTAAVAGVDSNSRHSNSDNSGRGIMMP